MARDVTAGDTLYFNFTSLDIAASPAVPCNTSGVTVSVYKDDSNSQTTDGVTVTGAFDSVVGLNNVKINTAANATFYAAGHNFQAIVTAGTVNSVSIVGYVLKEFSIQASAAYTLTNTVNTTVNTIDTNVTAVNTAVAAVNTNVNTVPGLVWEVALASHTNAGTTGKKLGDLSTGSAPSAATVANAVWEELLASHLNAGTYGLQLDTTVSSRASQTFLNAVSNTVNTVASNVSGMSTVVNTVNTNVLAVPGLVWEVDLPSHNNTNTTGYALNNISAGGTPPSASDVANAVWAAVVAEVANDADLRSSIGKMVRGVFERFFNKVTQTSSVQTLLKDDGVTTAVTMAVSDDGTTQTKGQSA